MVTVLLRNGRRAHTADNVQRALVELSSLLGEFASFDKLVIDLAVPVCDGGDGLSPTAGRDRRDDLHERFFKCAIKDAVFDGFLQIARHLEPLARVLGARSPTSRSWAKFFNTL